MTILFVITGLLLLVSFIANRQKTLSGLKKGAMQFLKLLPTLLTVIILVSVALFFTPEKMLIKYFGDQAGILGLPLGSDRGQCVFDTRLYLLSPCRNAP
ncbi:MAG: hypothetical protein U5L09_13820 [Bacteroidales bacterium]|nr:hypothetical protein [Bacteroidales bacterium]